MITEEKIVEILKQFEQQDFKRGGVSIDTSNYNDIARTVVKNMTTKTRKNEVSRVGSERVFGFVKSGLVGCSILAECFCPLLTNPCYMKCRLI